MSSISAALVISRHPAPPTAHRAPFVSLSRLKRVQALPFHCRCGPSPQVDSEEALGRNSLLGIPTSTWRAGLGAIGFLETSYLTFLKFTGSEAFCPVAGGSCSDVLNSDYAYVFGVPLPLIGMVAYGFVALLSLQQAGKNPLSGYNETDTQLILLGTTTSMASASAYFLYLLSTKLAGASCSYCLVSAILSFSLFFVTVKDIGFKEIRKLVVLQLVIAGIIVTTLNNSYLTATSQLSGDITLERYETEITKESTPFAISLAKHLHAIGAKMYGAFWCSHCMEQKEMFGRDAAKIIDYVECFPDGVGKGRKVAKECSTAGVEGFPTWIIKNEVLSGEKDLQALAEASGFVVEETLPS